MQGFVAIIVLVVVGWVVSTPWALAVVALIALAVIAFLAWEFATTLVAMRGPYEPVTTRQEPESARVALASRVEELEGALAAARRDASRLRAENDSLRRDLRAAQAASEETRSSALHRRVGLDQDAPKWFITAVRRAYRAKLHPDRHSPRLKQEAERRFKKAEAVFDRIEATRG